MALVPKKVSFRGYRNIFSASDNSLMMKQIVATHHPDERHFPVRRLLDIVENIIQRAPPGLTAVNQETQAQLAVIADNALQSESPDVVQIICHTISKISCEIYCKCSGGGDGHLVSMGLLNTLSSYSWDTKMVMAFAAFAVIFGKFWLVAQLYTTNYLAKAVALLKQLPEVLDRLETSKTKYNPISNLIKVMLDVTKCIVELKELPLEYISADAPEIKAADDLIPMAVYWTYRGIVACSTQLLGILGKNPEYIASTAEAWELSGLAHKLDNLKSYLKQQFILCLRHIDDKKQDEAFAALKHLLDTPCIENSKILKILIGNTEDQLPLFSGSIKKKVSIDTLKRKNVLIYITELDILNEELEILEQIYSESRQQPVRSESQYEVVWLPVVDKKTPWTEKQQKRFESLQMKMPWYSIFHPSQLDPLVIRYIKEVWKFNKAAILVVLDPQGKVDNPNAIHMMWIWGNLAYPFTIAREEELWKKEKWRLELLAYSIEPMIFKWVSEGKALCMYGGDDIDWIRKFTRTMRSVSETYQMTLEMLYVGRGNPGEKIRKANSIIVAENLSHVLTEISLIWLFWVRLESMWHSKLQHGCSVENDPIMQEVVTIMTYDGSDQGWAVFIWGKEKFPRMIKAKGESWMKYLDDQDLWKDRAQQKGLLPALDEYLQELHATHHCNRLILPGSTGSIPDMVICAECRRPMEKYFMYRCSTD